MDTLGVGAEIRGGQPGFRRTSFFGSKITTRWFINPLIGPPELDAESFANRKNLKARTRPSRANRRRATPAGRANFTAKSRAAAEIPEFFTRGAGGKTWRIAVMGNPYVTLVLAADMGEFKARMATVRNIYLVALAVVLLLVAGSAWIVARRALRPVTMLTEAAERVTAKGLDQRIPATAHEAEFNRLATVFNEMLGRLETSFQQATRFSADASHELKTPLARLQVELEQALENAPSGSPQQEVYSSLLDEISRLKAIVQKLLLLSLADAGRLPLQLHPVDLSVMLTNVVEDCQAQAPTLKIESRIPPGIHVNADRDLLEQALQNLAGNAVKYNHDGGLIRFELLAAGGQVVIRVANSGAPIPLADQDRIFERFYRADPARSGRVEGTGLGLSLAREIIRAHGGDLSLEVSEDNFTRFAVKLPSV